MQTGIFRKIICFLIKILVFPNLHFLNDKFVPLIEVQARVDHGKGIFIVKLPSVTTLHFSTTGFAYFLGVNFGGRCRALQGNLLGLCQVDRPPTISYDYIADPKDWYVLMMVDPDTGPAGLSYLHWLVVNIPGRRVSQGESLAVYATPRLPPGTGPHRYFLLLFKQPRRLQYSGDFEAARRKFSVRRFVNDHLLCDPVAINVFRACHDENDIILQ